MMLISERVISSETPVNSDEEEKVSQPKEFDTAASWTKKPDLRSFASKWNRNEQYLDKKGKIDGIKDQ